MFSMFQATVPLHADPEAELAHLRPEALVDWCLRMPIAQQHEGVATRIQLNDAYQRWKSVTAATSAVSLI
jgi:hypothetical protein